MIIHECHIRKKNSITLFTDKNNFVMNNSKKIHVHIMLKTLTTHKYHIYIYIYKAFHDRCMSPNIHSKMHFNFLKTIFWWRTVGDRQVFIVKYKQKVLVILYNSPKHCVPANLPCFRQKMLHILSTISNLFCSMQHGIYKQVNQWLNIGLYLPSWHM
jgi:hypothetical protein